MRVGPFVKLPTTARRLVLPALLAVWALTTATAFAWLWSYESAPGAQHATPAATQPSRTTYTLLVFLHPKCPCSRATVAELARLTARAGDRLSTEVFLVLPPGAGDDWLATPLRTSAAAIPGVTVAADRGGVLARRYGAATSGHVVLYGPDGRLAFAGGITQSRGHEGDNAGESAILEAINAGTVGARPARTPVFGCALFDDDSSSDPIDAQKPSFRKALH